MVTMSLVYETLNQNTSYLNCGFNFTTAYSLSHKTVNTRENFWNVYCFATNQERDEPAKDNCQTAAWIGHDLIRNSKLAFSSNELAFLPRLTFKNQGTEFGIDLEASVNCQNLQWYKFSDEGFPATKKYASKTTNHSQLA